MTEPGSERDPLELLAAEYMDMLRRGMHPSVEDYASRHPELAEEIRELFPTIAATEQWKLRRARTSDGRASLGPARLERLGDFRLIREIGRGGMGVVFEAEQESLGRRVAVKVLPRQVLLEAKHLERFEREARIAAGLHHTNIVEVFGVGEQDGFHYYVMQYIDGVGLDGVISLLAERKAGNQSARESMSLGSAAAPDPGRASAGSVVTAWFGEESHETAPPSHAYWLGIARMGWQAADALGHAHRHGILHRDIKPANLLVGAQGTVWLADFGLAKATQAGDFSNSREVVGTLRYMAPEQFQGQADHRGDIYSLGLTLYELLVLGAAYEETDQSRLIRRITQGPAPTRPRARGLKVPRDLETIILKAASHEPGQRYASASEMADDFRRFIEDRPICARPVGPAERLGRWCRRNKGLASLTAATATLVLTVAVVASVGYVRTTRALLGQAQERAKAEANARLAMEALDRMFERFSPTRMRLPPQGSLPGLEPEVMRSSGSAVLSREAAGLLEEMLPFYDRLARQTDNDNVLQARTAEANRRVGAIRQRLGQFDEAAQAYQRSITLFSELHLASPADAHLALQLARAHNELGRVHGSRRQMADARKAHESALSVLEAAGKPQAHPPDWSFELARTYYLLGIEERPLPSTDGPPSQGRARIPRERNDPLAKAVTLLRTSPESTRENPEHQHLLALCYLEGAEVDETDKDAPMEGADRAIRILEQVVRAFPDIPDYAYDLSEAYARMHIPPAPIPPEAQRSLQSRLDQSLALLENLVAQHPDVPDFLAAAARTHDKLGSLHRGLDQWHEAEQDFRRAIALQASLEKRFPGNLQHGLWMATFRIALADALLQQNQPGAARTELEDSMTNLLSHLGPGTIQPRPHDLISQGYSALARAFRMTGDNDRADEAERQASDERRAARQIPSPR